jgi:lysyl-tRNA synthetase class 2
VFRNEGNLAQYTTRNPPLSDTVGIDHSHNPEFTTCEFYMAYGHFAQLLTMTTAIVTRIAQAATAAGFPHAVPLGLTTGDFAVVSYLDVLSQHVDSVTMAQLRTDPESAVPGLQQACADLNIRPDTATTAAALVDKLGSVLVEEVIERPTFVIEHPLVLSPLAMEDPSKVLSVFVIVVIVVVR